MKPLIIISILGYLGWLYQFDASRKLEAAYVTKFKQQTELGNRFAFENFTVGLKAGYILKSKNGTKEDVAKVIAEWPQLNYINNFNTQ